MPLEAIAARIRDVPDFPKPGILFKDITPLLLDSHAFAAAIERMAAGAPTPDAVVAIESRGFIFGTALALHWKVPLVPARKFGKLPGKTIRRTYALEYGEDTLELHADALQPGQNVVIVDDVLATGGTAATVASLVEDLRAQVASLRFLIELEELEGRARLAKYDVASVLRLSIGST